MDNIKVKNIFAAVAEKSVLGPLLKILDPKSVKFWGTEGTMEYVKVKGYSGKSVVTGFDFDGRVKTVDKKVFAAVLADQSKKSHMDELSKLGVEPIDLVVVDLYKPDSGNFPESMDIGGQALIRAAIKNYKYEALAFDAESIKDLVEELNSKRGWSSFRFRKAQAQKAAKFIADRCEEEAVLFSKK